MLDTDQEDGDIDVKLSDFGLACKYEADKPPTEKCGSLLSVAPEMLTDETYDHKVDIWGMGIVLHELLCEDAPFYSDDDSVHKDNIVHQPLELDVENEKWQKVSEEGKDLTRKLLVKDPKTRLSAMEALDHPWFDELNIPKKRDSNFSNES